MVGAAGQKGKAHDVGRRRGGVGGLAQVLRHENAQPAPAVWLRPCSTFQRRSVANMSHSNRSLTVAPGRGRHAAQSGGHLRPQCLSQHFGPGRSNRRSRPQDDSGQSAPPAKGVGESKKNRSPSRAPKTRSKICWYHFRVGIDASPRRRSRAGSSGRDATACPPGQSEA